MNLLTFISQLASHGQVAINCKNTSPGIVIIKRNDDLSKPDEIFDIEDITFQGEGKETNVAIVLGANRGS